MFSAAFSSAFAGVAAPMQYVCPVMAQAAIVDGAAVEIAGSALRIGGKTLIGPAGKIFAFTSPVAALKWVEVTRNIGTRERSLIAQLPEEAADIWKSEKREKLAVIAGRLVTAAVRVTDGAKRAALLAESEFCLAKWA